MDALLLTPTEVSILLRTKEDTLKKWRTVKRYPQLDAAVRHIGRSVMYDAATIRELARTGFS